MKIEPDQRIQARTHSADGLWLASQLVAGPVFCDAILDAAAARGMTHRRLRAAQTEIGAVRSDDTMAYLLPPITLPYWQALVANAAQAKAPPVRTTTAPLQPKLEPKPAAPTFSPHPRFIYR